MMCPKLLRETFLFWPASNGCDWNAHAARKLNPEVTEPADSLNSDELAGPGLSISHPVECRQSGAEEWRRFRWNRVVRNCREPTRLGDHHFGVTTITVNTRN